MSASVLGRLGNSGREPEVDGFVGEQSEASALVEPKGGDVMRAASELKFQAKECLKLADRTNDYYARTVLIELAQRLNREARQAERRNRDLALSHPSN
jgi:hypothetical protein